MTQELRDQIHNSLNLKETDELLDIWQDNDRSEWSDLAFEVIQEILRQRLGAELPPQDEPIYQRADPDEDEADELEAGNAENKYLDEANAPVFYKPSVVLQLVDWLRWAAGVAVAISAVWNILQIPNFARNQLGYFFPIAPAYVFIPYLLAVVVAVLDTAITYVVVYLPVRALGQILSILMEMEFNSRGVK